MASDFYAVGPVADGRAAEIVQRATEAIEQKIAEKARDKVRDRQLRSIKVQHTGAEPASIHVENSELGKVVTDLHSIAYGPWLEGTGSRNETTRFKGYHAFRIVFSEIESQAKGDAEQIVRPYVEEINR